MTGHSYAPAGIWEQGALALARRFATHLGAAENREKILIFRISDHVCHADVIRQFH
jgi:hypothetical protein